MKIILCGYNWAGCKALQLLLEEGYEVFVFTHEAPFHIPSLIEYCKRSGIEYTTDNISKVNNLPFAPDIICSIYYRNIIGQHIIDKCKGRIFNLHPSLLPKYRGCSSLTWAMVKGEREVGFTFHYIERNVDSGNVLIQKPLKLEAFDNQGLLYARVMFEAMKYFLEALHLVDEGYEGTQQKGKPSYYKRGVPYKGFIDNGWTEEQIKRYIKAMIHPPYALAKYQGHEIKSYDQFLKIKQQKQQ